MGDRVPEFQKKIQNEGFDAFLLTNTTNVYYFTNFFSRSYAFMIVYPESAPLLLVPELEYEEATNKVKNCEILKVDMGIKILELLKDKFESEQVKVLAFEDATMTVRFYLELFQKMEFLKFKKGSKLVEELRNSKNKDEIEKIKRACEIADKGISAAIENITEGRTEIEVAAEIEYVMRNNGSESHPFDTIVASGYRSAFPHGVSTNKKIALGDLIIVDLGAKYEGYCSDMTRTVVLGSPNQKQLEIFNEVLSVQQEVIKICSVGKRAVKLDEFVREFLAKKELNEFFVHSLGHGVGLDVHELPAVAPESEDILKENSVFTIEPGVYIPDVGGVRIEDVILLTKKGAELLTKSEYSISI